MEVPFRDTLWIPKYADIQTIWVTSQPPNPTGAMLQQGPEMILKPTEATCNSLWLCGPQNVHYRWKKKLHMVSLKTGCDALMVFWGPEKPTGRSVAAPLPKEACSKAWGSSSSHFWGVQVGLSLLVIISWYHGTTCIPCQTFSHGPFFFWPPDMMLTFVNITKSIKLPTFLHENLPHIHKRVHPSYLYTCRCFCMDCLCNMDQSDT